MRVAQSPTLRCRPPAAPCHIRAPTRRPRAWLAECRVAVAASAAHLFASWSRGVRPRIVFLPTGRRVDSGPAAHRYLVRRNSVRFAVNAFACPSEDEKRFFTCASDAESATSYARTGTDDTDRKPRAADSNADPTHTLSSSLPSPSLSRPATSSARRRPPTPSSFLAASKGVRVLCLPPVFPRRSCVPCFAFSLPIKAHSRIPRAVFPDSALNLSPAVEKRRLHLALCACSPFRQAFGSATGRSNDLQPPQRRPVPLGKCKTLLAMIVKASFPLPWFSVRGGL